MITDPYKVLGISYTASNDEIKKAYRELSRKYHPDSYIDNPLSDLAEEKFKEIQEAYQQIMDEREKGFSKSSYTYGNQNTSSRSSSNTYTNSQEDIELGAAANYINSRHYHEALNVLNGISNRTGRWYYFHALANAGLGNLLESQNSAKQAVNMEPGNLDYMQLLNQLQRGSQRYQNAGFGYGRSNYSTGDLCCDLWCADTLCECMGGDLCSCM